uniref:Uncharacterized protein n=1 Tax=Panagrolaimus davidi TaxID=227884 RepID=A0A914PRZ8_9BILA
MLPENSFYYCIFAFVLCAIGTGHSIFVSFLYRIVKLISDGKVAKFYSIKWLIFPARIITLTSSLAIFMIPLILENTKLNELKNVIIGETNLMTFFFNNPKFNGIGGYHISVGNGWIKIFFIEISCLCILLFISIMMIHYFFIWQMRKFRAHVSASTYRLHQMLYRALTIQLAFVTVELIFPLAIYFFLYYFQVRNGSFFGTLFISLTSFYPNCNFIVVCYYIKPYRIYILKKTATILERLGCEKAKIVSFSLSKSTHHAGYNVY